MGYKKGSGKPRKIYSAIVYLNDGTNYRQDGIRVKKVFNKLLLQPWRNVKFIEWIK